MKDARAETAKYQAALKGTGNGFYSAVTSILCVNDNWLSSCSSTGGGPQYVWKNPLLQKIFEEVMGPDNPSLPGNQIPVEFSWFLLISPNWNFSHRTVWSLRPQSMWNPYSPRPDKSSSTDHLTWKMNQTWRWLSNFFYFMFLWMWLAVWRQVNERRIAKVQQSRGHMTPIKFHVIDAPFSKCLGVQWYRLQCRTGIVLTSRVAISFIYFESQTKWMYLIQVHTDEAVWCAYDKWCHLEIFRDLREVLPLCLSIEQSSKLV